MRVVFFIQNFSRGHGSERVTSLIASYLAEQNYTVQIVSICGDNTSFFQINEKIKLFTLINQPDVDNKKSFFKVLNAYNRYLRQFKPDVVIDVFASMSIYTLTLRKKYGFKNITWEHYNYYNNLGVYKLCRKIAIHESNKIITLTKTDMDTYLSYNPTLAGRIDYIYNPTPFESADFDYSEKEKLVLAVGRLVKLKGYHHLVDVWSMVETACADWKLFIVGEGEERESIEQQIDRMKLRNIRLMGETSAVNEYYRRASILVSTSDVEGLPMNMIEAQSFGIPIVSFDYYSGPRDIITDGVNGFIINGKSQTEKNKMMGDALIRLIQNDEDRILFSQNALNASLRFNKQSICSKWIETLQKINEQRHV